MQQNVQEKKSVSENHIWDRKAGMETTERYNKDIHLKSFKKQQSVVRIGDDSK